VVVVPVAASLARAIGGSWRGLAVGTWDEAAGSHRWFLRERQNQICLELDAKTWNTPALAGEHLLVRNDQEAACYRLARKVLTAKSF
jgi:hypothetical protein